VARKVVFRPAAEADLLSLYQYIAEASGPIVAGSYVDRIEDACLSLAAFPARGVRRDDIVLGLRTISVERRLTIAYRVRRAEVEIVAIAYGGRDFEHGLREEDKKGK
jgi:toxin ParE1/3/4